MAALAERAGRLQAPGIAADDRDLLALRRDGDLVVRQLQLAAGRGVVHAERRPGGVDAVDAHIGADTRPDEVCLALGDLARQVRVGDERPGHADEVEQALGDRVAGGRQGLIALESLLYLMVKF